MKTYQRGSVGLTTQQVTQYDDIDMDTVSLSNGVPIQVETVPRPIISKVDVFYVCATCGKVYWEGGHFARVLDQFSHILVDSDTNHDRLGGGDQI